MFILSEEIKQPASLKRGHSVQVEADPLVPHGIYPSTTWVKLPTTTPYPAGASTEVSYFKGYALGYFDATFVRLICRSNAGDRVKAGFAQGYEIGYEDGKRKRTL